MKNLFSNILSAILLIITFIFIKDLFGTPMDATIFDADGLEKTKDNGISPIVEQSSLIGRRTKIHAPTDNKNPNGIIFDIFTDAPRRGSLSAAKPSGTTEKYIGNDVELLQFVRNTNGSWVQVYDIDANKEYWVRYEATLPVMPKVSWDR